MQKTHKNRSPPPPRQRPPHQKHHNSTRLACRILRGGIGVAPLKVSQWFLLEKKKEPKAKLFGPDGWGGGVGVFHVKGWGPKSLVCP